MWPARRLAPVTINALPITGIIAGDWHTALVWALHHITRAVLPCLCLPVAVLVLCSLVCLLFVCCVVLVGLLVGCWLALCRCGAVVRVLAGGAVPEGNELALPMYK